MRAQYPSQYYMYPTTSQNNQYGMMSSIQAQDSSHNVESNPAPNIMSQMKDLTDDVSGFHDAMAGMAEALIVSKQNKDGTFTVEEKLRDDAAETSTTKRGHKKSKLSRRQKQKAAKKLAGERRRFEKEMVKFFTNFMCDKEC